MSALVVVAMMLDACGEAQMMSVHAVALFDVPSDAKLAVLHDAQPVELLVEQHAAADTGADAQLHEK